MSSPTFGQLLSAADERLKSAETDPSIAGVDLGPDLLRITGALRRMVNRFCVRGDVAGLPPADAPLWEQAAAELAAMFELADDHLASHVNVDSSTPLALTADALLVASDLLATHFDGQDGERSEWSEVIASGPVTRALTEESATWARRLAPWVRWLGEQNGMASPLLAASRDLQLASRATAIAGKAQPITDDDRALLHAIPTAAMTERISPREGESATELYIGIARTAERLRFIAFHAADRAAWSPSISARTWQYAATAAAITTDIAGVLLHALADHRTDLRGVPTADTLVAARDTWQNLASTLASVATDTPPALGPEATDLSDLVIRMGRLASGNPALDTPALRRTTGLRPPVQQRHRRPEHTGRPSPEHRRPRRHRSRTLVGHHHGDPRRPLVRTNALAPGGIRHPTPLRPDASRPRRSTRRHLRCGGQRQHRRRRSARVASPSLRRSQPPHRPGRQAIRREETATNPAAPQPATSPDPQLAQRLAALGVADIDLALRAAVIDKAAAKLIGDADHRARRKNTPSPHRPRGQRLCQVHPACVSSRAQSMTEPPGIGPGIWQSG